MSQSVTSTIIGHIAVIDGQPTTTTQNIAEVYGKRHDDVLRVVRQRIAEAGEWGIRNFSDTPYTNPQNGQTYPVIRMTKKGFHFVVGKFTGAKAVAHQIAFADEFERMERELVANATPTAIGNAQQQHLHELVDIVVASGKQTHGETWKRLHRKFHVSRYEDLPTDQFDAACQYLRGKLEGHDIGSLVKKHFPGAAQALPAPTGTERMLITKNLATGETTVENLGTESLLFKSPDHVAHAVMDCRLGADVTQKIAQHAMLGLISNTHALKKQIRSQAVTETLSMMNTLPAADLVELSTSAHAFLAGMALKTPPLPAAKGDRLMEAALSASAHA